MTGPSPQSALDPELHARLERLGIAVVPRPVFEWGGYRYSNASDAITAAERAGQ